MADDKPIVATVTVLDPDYAGGPWAVEVIERPEGDWMITTFHGVQSEERARAYAEFLRDSYASSDRLP